MPEMNNDYNTVENVISQQLDQKPTQQTISSAIRDLRFEELPEYIEFIEETHNIKLDIDSGKCVLEKLGIKNKEFIDIYADKLTPKNILELQKLTRSKPDQLVDNYLNTKLPDELVNDYVLSQAIKINRNFEGKYKNALDIIQLAVKLNSVRFAGDILDAFLTMEETYYREHEPAIDAPTFFKLVIPVLHRLSEQKGLEAYYEARDRIIAELEKHGIAPDQLSIHILDRRGKNGA